MHHEVSVSLPARGSTGLRGGVACPYRHVGLPILLERELEAILPVKSVRSGGAYVLVGTEILVVVALYVCQRQHGQSRRRFPCVLQLTLSAGVATSKATDRLLLFDLASE